MPTSEELAAQIRALNAADKRERDAKEEQLAEKAAAKRHKKEVDQFALAASRMDRQKNTNLNLFQTPQPAKQPISTAASSSDATVTIVHEKISTDLERHVTSDGVTTTTDEHETQKINRVIMTFPSGHSLIEGELQMLRANGGADHFQRFKAHFTKDIKNKDLSKYPWLHFIIPAMGMDEKTALTCNIRALDKNALVDFISINDTTSLLVYKPSRTRKLAALVPALETERLIQKPTKGRHGKANVELMLTKRAEVGEHLTNLWLHGASDRDVPRSRLQPAGALRLP